MIEAEALYHTVGKSCNTIQCKPSFNIVPPYHLTISDELPVRPNVRRKECQNDVDDKHAVYDCINDQDNRARQFESQKERNHRGSVQNTYQDD